MPVVHSIKVADTNTLLQRYSLYIVICYFPCVLLNVHWIKKIFQMKVVEHVSCTYFYMRAIQMKPTVLF